MTNPLKILYIEDSDDYVVLVLRLLCDSGLEVLMEHVNNMNSLRNALVEKQWDIIISDYSMPDFDGLDATRLIREVDKNIPIIILSGGITESQVRDVLCAGANYYVKKNELDSLIEILRDQLQD